MKKNKKEKEKSLSNFLAPMYTLHISKTLATHFSRASGSLEYGSGVPYRTGTSLEGRYWLWGNSTYLSIFIFPVSSNYLNGIERFYRVLSKVPTWIWTPYGALSKWVLGRLVQDRESIPHRHRLSFSLRATGPRCDGIIDRPIDR